MDALESLAARYGIEESFRDARGTVQTTTAATRRALLTAIGIDAENEQAARSALNALDRQEWLEVLPPVHVAFDADAVNLPVIGPAATERVTWGLALENGEERSGTARFAALRLLRRRDIDGQPMEQRSLVLEGPLPYGYHRLTLTPGDADSSLIVTPGTCWLPAGIEQGMRFWGVAAQLYLLKSATNWGIGDFSDLRRLAQVLVDRGAQVIGLNPLHAMFVDEPEHASPY